MAAIESVLGDEIWERLENKTQVPSFRVLRGIFWGGLYRLDKTITLDGAGDILHQLVNETNVGDVAGQLLDALDNAFPDADEVEGVGGDGDLGNAQAG